MAYSKPPITEAIIDIQVENTGHDLARLQSLKNAIPGFETEKAITVFQSQFKIGPEGAQLLEQPTPNGRIGFIFWSMDNTRAWQARQNGCGISHLKPYQSWENLLANAKLVWEAYRKEVSSRITRVAIRYINRFDIPTNSPIEFTDYFQTAPQIAKEMDTGLSRFSMQLVQPQVDLSSMLVLNLAQIPPALPNTVAVVLDFDLSRETDVPQNDADLWALLSQFRERKNTLFECCITEKLRELIR